MGEDSARPDEPSNAAEPSNPAEPSPQVAPILEWIRGAEAHLAALQADHDRVRQQHEQQAIQLDRLTSRLAVLEARVVDLERADTDLAVSIARLQAVDPGQ